MSSKTPTESYIVKRTEFLVVSAESDTLGPIKEMAKYFSFNAEYIEKIEDLQTTATKTSPAAILISLSDYSKIEEKLEAVVQARHLYLRSQIIALISANEGALELEQLRGAGVHRFLQPAEIKDTGKFYYLCSLLVRGAYLPISVLDLFPGTQVEFNAYHKLPINQQYLPVIFSGFLFSDKKYRRLESVKQVYVRREDLDTYRKYIETFHDRRGNALKKRCRATMMSLMAAYTELILVLSLDSEKIEPALLNEQCEQFIQIATELADYLKDCPDVWNVVAQSLEFQFCQYERGPHILAYALFIARKIEWGSLQEVILGVLLTDVGLLDLPANCFKQLQKRGALQLTESELDLYRSHPEISLNRCLQKGVVVSEELSKILLCTHERVDEKGFPNRTSKEQLPFESQLIQFCEILDQRVRTTLEDGMVTHDFVRRQVWEEEKFSLKCFNEDFLDKIELAVLTAVA